MKSYRKDKGQELLRMYYVRKINRSNIRYVQEHSSRQQVYLHLLQTFHKQAGCELYTPASIWNVGDLFESDPYKLKFVRKPARGLPGDDTGYGFLDCRKCGSSLYNHVSRPYWSYTKEIDKLRPKNIIFYTHYYYDEYIEKLSIGDAHIDITDRSFRIPNGNKYMSWWHRDFYKDGCLIMRMLRTSHPERQQKEGYVSKITDWIKAGV